MLNILYRCVSKPEDLSCAMAKFCENQIPHPTNSDFAIVNSTLHIPSWSRLLSTPPKTCPYILGICSITIVDIKKEQRPHGAAGKTWPLQDSSE